ncbi:hypothetical protein GF319_15160 [Candidatus Bathyarchaeota archaeon]|nr:hypothetical protein [Candidatus Bathyarchaeota archaeon]
MSDESIVEQLSEFGLNTEEASIYILLVKGGPATASQVASQLDYNRVKTYRILDSLVEKGFVSETPERPKKFIPTDTREALSGYLAKFRRRIDSLQEHKDTIIEEFDKISDKTVSYEETTFRILQGRPQVFNLIDSMLKRAEDEVKIYIPGDDLYRFEFVNLDKLIKSLNSEGVEVYLLTQITLDLVERIKEYLKYVRVNHLEKLDRFRFIIKDGKEVFFTFTMEDSMSLSTEEDTGLWTNTESFVLAMDSFFDENWRISKNGEEVVTALNKGEEPQRIQVISEEDRYQKIYENMLSECSISAKIMIDNLGHLKSLESIWGDLINRNVDLKILSELDYTSLASLLELIPQETIRDIETGFELLLVDGKRALMFMPTIAGYGDKIYSNNDFYCQSMAQVFDDYWIKGRTIESIAKKLAEEVTLKESLKILKENIPEKWKVTTDKQLTIKKLGNIKIDCLLEYDEGTRIIIEYSTGGEASSTIAETYSKISNIDAEKAIIISTRPYSESDTNLAKMFKIDLIYENDPHKLAHKILQKIQT